MTLSGTRDFRNINSGKMKVKRELMDVESRTSTIVKAGLWEIGI